MARVRLPAMVKQRLRVLARQTNPVNDGKDQSSYYRYVHPGPGLLQCDRRLPTVLHPHPLIEYFIFLPNVLLDWILECHQRNSIHMDGSLDMAD